MNLNKPKFWDKRISITSILIFPITLIVLIIIFFKKKFSKLKFYKIPIICVGNIYIGGTGKTPISIFLAKELLSLGRNPVILKKYYKNQNDENELIKNNFKNFILCEDRDIGIRKAEKNLHDSVILDDGFQDYKIKKNLSIICFNKKQLIGNGLVLPSGPLRETLVSLKNANIVLINGDKDRKFEEKILGINKNLDIFYSKYIPSNIEDFKNKKLLALAGIGNPENFFDLIEEYGLKIYEKMIFPDHYVFSKNEILNIIKKAKDNKLEIIMTEKDFFKIRNFEIDNLKYLKVSLVINEKEKLINIVNNLYEKNY